MLPISRTKISLCSHNFVGRIGVRLFIFGTSETNLTYRVIRSATNGVVDKKVVSRKNDTG